MKEAIVSPDHLTINILSDVAFIDDPNPLAMGMQLNFHSTPTDQPLGSQLSAILGRKISFICPNSHPIATVITPQFQICVAAQQITGRLEHNTGMIDEASTKQFVDALIAVLLALVPDEQCVDVHPSPSLHQSDLSQSAFIQFIQALSDQRKLGTGYRICETLADNLQDLIEKTQNPAHFIAQFTTRILLTQTPRQSDTQSSFSDRSLDSPSGSLSAGKSEKTPRWTPRFDSQSSSESVTSLDSPSDTHSPRNQIAPSTQPKTPKQALDQEALESQDALPDDDQKTPRKHRFTLFFDKLRHKKSPRNDHATTSDNALNTHSPRSTSLLLERANTSPNLTTSDEPTNRPQSIVPTLPLQHAKAIPSSPVYDPQKSPLTLSTPRCFSPHILSNYLNNRIERWCHQQQIVYECLNQRCRLLYLKNSVIVRVDGLDIESSDPDPEKIRHFVDMLRTLRYVQDVPLDLSDEHIVQPTHQNEEECRLNTLSH